MNWWQQGTRWVGIAVFSKHIMHSVYASHRRRSLARLRFTRDRRWRDFGDGCGVGLSNRCRRCLCSPFSKGRKSFWRLSNKSNMFLSVIVSKQVCQYVSCWTTIILYITYIKRQQKLTVKKDLKLFENKKTKGCCHAKFFQKKFFVFPSGL